MKKLIAIALMIALIVPAYAQFGGLKKAKKRLQQKVEDKLERRAERKVDREIDKALDDVFDGNKKRKSDQTTDSNTNEEEEIPEVDMSKIAGMYGGSKADIASSYTYNLQVKWKMTPENGKVMHMEQMMSEDGKSISIRTQGHKVIQDFDKMKMITLMEGNHLMIMDLNKILDFAEDFADEDNDDVVEGQIEFTGKTKIIAGYNCEQILYKGERGEQTETWYTKDLNGLSSNYYENYFKSNPELSSQYSKLSGMPLEMTTTTSEGETITMEATSITKEKVTYNMSEFKVMNMGY